MLPDGLFGLRALSCGNAAGLLMFTSCPGWLSLAPFLLTGLCFGRWGLRLLPGQGTLVLLRILVAPFAGSLVSRPGEGPRTAARTGSARSPVPCQLALTCS